MMVTIELRVCTSNAGHGFYVGADGHRVSPYYTTWEAAHEAAERKLRLYLGQGWAAQLVVPK